MGFANWGFYYSQMPQRLIMDNVTKVAFPTLSRLQDDPKQFRATVERMMQFICLLIFPMLVGIALSWSHLAFMVPKWFKWQPALLPLYLYCFSAILSCLSTPLTNTLYALGKAKINTYLMIMWLALEWAIKPIMAMRLGYIGVAYATAIIAFSSFVPFFIAKKIIGFSAVKSLGLVTVATVIMVAVGVLTRPLNQIVLTLSLSSLAYGLTVFVFGGKKLLSDAQPFYEYFKKKL